MDTDLGRESRDFLTPRSTGPTALQGEEFSAQSSLPKQGDDQLIRLCVGGCWVVPSRYLQTPSLLILGSRAGPVPKGRARKKTSTFRALGKLEEG